MATAPVKSQPLHNFPLSFLKWGGTSTAKNNHPNSNHHHHHRFRRPTSSDLPPSLSPDHPSDPDSEPPRFGPRTSRNNRFALSSSPKQLSNNCQTDDEAAVTEDAVAEEALQKPWNLRPRKQPAAPASAVGAKNGNGEVNEPVHSASENNAGMVKSLRVRGDAAMVMQCGERKKELKKNKFWIALSKEEIEEDIFAMTGSRPNRRPKKRPKNVQKQMDCVFPGLWLVGLTADAYKLKKHLGRGREAVYQITAC